MSKLFVLRVDLDVFLLPYVEKNLYFLSNIVSALLKKISFIKIAVLVIKFSYVFCYVYIISVYK